MTMMYRNVDRKDDEELKGIQARADWIRSNIESV
jgi:hypothetical protein